MRNLIKMDVALCCMAAAFGSDSCKAEASQPIDVARAGATPDGKTLVSEVLNRIVAQHPQATLTFRDGSYLLDNSQLRTGLRLEGFSGTIQMSKGARFLCSDATAKAGQCLWILRSHHLSFQNLTVTYRDIGHLPLERTRATSNAILVERSSDITFNNTVVIGSTGSGIWTTDSVHLLFFGGTKISRTSADGIHFENVGASTVRGLETQDTGDDGIGVTNITKGQPNCGLVANHIRIRSSRSRGIATAGACDASFSNVVIEETANSALAATQDTSILSRISTGISFAHVKARGVGTLPGIHGNGYCLDIGTAKDVSGLDIVCDDSRENGVFIYAGAQHVVLKDIHVQASGNNGIQTDHASGVILENVSASHSRENGFDFENSDEVTLRVCSSDESGGYGFFHSGDGRVTEYDLRIRNAARKHGNHRAWWAERMKGTLKASVVRVIDDQPVATGFLVGESASGVAQIEMLDLSFTVAQGVGAIQKTDAHAVFAIVKHAASTDTAAH